MPRSGHILSTLKHASVYGAAGVLGKLISFFLLPVYAHYLRGEGYGIVGMIDVVLTVLAVLIAYGITGAMSRFYFEKAEEGERKVLISTAVILMFCIVVAVCTPALIFAGPISRLAFGEAGTTLYIVLAVLTFMAEMTSKNAQSYILIRQKSFLFSALSLLSLVVSLTLNIYFIVYLEMGVLGYLYAALIVAVLFTIVMHIYVLMDTGLHFNRQDARDILRFTLPLIPGYLAFFVRGNTCRILLRVFYGLSLVGAYEMLFKFATLIGVLIVEPFSRIWGIKQLEICENPEGPATMARFFTIQMAVMLFAGLALSLETPLILRLLTPEEFWLGGTVAFLAVTSRIILAAYNHMNFGLLYAKRTGRISAIQFASAGFNLVISLLLIRPLGILGAVIAACLTNLFHCVVAYRMSLGHYYIPFEWGKIARLAALYLVFFVGIESLAREGDFLYHQIASQIEPAVKAMVALVQLDHLREGRWAAKALAGLPLLLDGLGRLLMSFLFIFGLFACRIFSMREVVQFFHRRPIGREILGEN